MSCNEACRKLDGTGLAHCGACHETFDTVTSFDAHRIGNIYARRCAKRPAIGLKWKLGTEKGPVELNLYSNGVWGTEGYQARIARMAKAREAKKVAE